MSKEDLSETNSRSRAKFESNAVRSRSHSLPEPKGVSMKENPDSVPHESGSGNRSSPLGAATSMSADPNSSASWSYSYLNNPKVNFGSEVPHTLTPDANTLSPAPAPAPHQPPYVTTSDSRTPTYSMLERLAFPYRLLRKCITDKPDTLPSDDSSENLDGKRDVGTLVQSISLILNGQNTSAENNNNTLNSLLEVPTSIAPDKGSNGTQPTRPVPDRSKKPLIDDADVHSIPTPLLIEMYPKDSANGKRKLAEQPVRVKTQPETETTTKEGVSSPTRNVARDTSSDSSSPSDSCHGTSLSASSKSTNLFEVISKHVMSITSPGQSFDSSHSSLPRFQNQTSPIITDSMFLRGPRSSDNSVAIVDDSFTMSSEEPLMCEDLQNGLSSELSSFDTKYGEQNNAHEAAVNINNDVMFGKDSKNITVLELPYQMSVQNIFDEEYLSGEKQHSFNSMIPHGQPSDESASISYQTHSDITGNEQEVTKKNGNGLTSDLSGLVRSIGKQTNANTSKKYSDSPKIGKTESSPCKDTTSLTTMELPSQLSLYNLFDKDYISGEKKHSFSYRASKGYLSDDDSTINYLHRSNDDIKKETGHVRKRESFSVMELRSLMSKHGLLEEKNVSEIGTTKAQPLGTNPIHIHDSVQDVNGIGQTKSWTSGPIHINFDDSIEDNTRESNRESKVKSPSVQQIRSVMSIHNVLEDNNMSKGSQTNARTAGSIRINNDDSVQDVTGKSGRGLKGESPNVQELRSLMSKHCLLDEKNVNGELQSKAQPSGSIRISFDDSIEDTIGESDVACKLKSPSVQEICSTMSIHGLWEDKNIPGKETHAPLENSEKHNISVKESMPRTWYIEESFAPLNEKSPQSKRRDTKGNAFDILIKQRDNSITIEIVEPDSRAKKGLPLESSFDGIKQNDSLKVQPKRRTITSDSITARETNSFDIIDSDEHHKSTSTYVIDEAGRYSFNGDHNNLKGKSTDLDEKLLYGSITALKDLHSMLNAEFSDTSRLSWRDLPILLYPSMHKTSGVVHGMPGDSISDSESQSQELDPSESLEEGTPSESVESNGEATEDLLEESFSGSDDSPNSSSHTNVSTMTDDASSTSESTAPVGSDYGSEDSPSSSSPVDWNTTITVMSSASDSSVIPDESGSRSEESPQSDSLDNWIPTPAVSSGEKEMTTGDETLDEFDSRIKFSQLEFPTISSGSEGSTTTNASRWYPSEIAEPAADNASTRDNSIAKALSLMKFLTTGSVKSFDIDEKLSEAHGHSKHVSNKYDTLNERNLNLGAKSSGHMPKPQEMLSIYSRGESEPPRVDDDDDPETNVKIKPALRKYSDARNNEASASPGAKTMPDRKVSRSVSFSEKLQEFPWRSETGYSMQATVETDSPLAESPSQRSRDRSSRAEESTSPAVAEEGDGNATDGEDKKDKDGGGQEETGGDKKDNEPEKKANEDAAADEQPATVEKSSSGEDGGGEQGEKKADEEPNESNSDDASESRVFSFENMLPYLRLFFTPALDEVALDMAHVVRGDPGCELCPQRRKEDEAQARVIPRQETRGESGDEERPQDEAENEEKQQEQEEGDGQQSQNKEQEERKEDDDKENQRPKSDDQRRKSSVKKEEEKEEVTKEKGEDEKVEEGGKEKDEDEQVDEIKGTEEELIGQ